jgi:RNA polymerase sigma factor (sigma-70 family)
MPGGPRGDEGELFERYHHRLMRITAHEVATSRDNVEEACAFAWAQLLSHDVRRDTAFAWLRQVARREAMRLGGIDRGVIPLGHEPGAIDPDIALPSRGNPAVTTERWTVALSRLRRLPERDRHVVALRAFGWKYRDIAEELGISLTRVNQILTRADAHLAELEDRERPAHTPRVARLRELEEHPPRWLRDAIGRRPAYERRRRNGNAIIREWRRLALALDDYRRTYEVQDPRRALGPAAKTRDQRVQRDELRARIGQFEIDLGRGCR